MKQELDPEYVNGLKKIYTLIKETTKAEADAVGATHDHFVQLMILWNLHAIEKQLAKLTEEKDPLIVVPGKGVN